MNLNRKLLLLVVAGVLLTRSLAHGQAVSGTIYGFVSDESGAVVPLARVTARNTETNYTRSTETATGGDYRFASLPLGPYTLTVEKTGFTQFVQRGVTLQVDQQARV